MIAATAPDRTDWTAATYAVWLGELYSDIEDLTGQIDERLADAQRGLHGRRGFADTRKSLATARASLRRAVRQQSGMKELLKNPLAVVMMEGFRGWRDRLEWEYQQRAEYLHSKLIPTFVRVARAGGR